MNISEYQKQLKEIATALRQVDILKKQSGSIEILHEKENIPNSNQFLMELSSLRDAALKINEAIDWIQRTARSDEDDY